MKDNIQNPKKEPYRNLLDEEFDTGSEFIKPYSEMINTDEGKRIAKEAGINQFIDPQIGEMLSIRSISAEEDERQDGNDLYVKDHITNKEIKNPFPYHFASVIAKSGSDYITIENYARRENGEVNGMDPRFFFKMYGSKKQSFHEELKSDYPNAMTFVYGKQSSGAKVPEYDIDSPQFMSMQEYYNSKLNQMV